MERASPAWQADSLPLSLLGRPKEQLSYSYFNNNPYFKLDAYCCGPSCCSVTQLCLTLYEPMNCSSAGFPVLYPLLEFAQTLSIDSVSLHWIGDAIQPTHPLSSPSPAFSLSQHQGLFQWVGSSHQVAKDLELQLQHIIQYYVNYFIAQNVPAFITQSVQFLSRIQLFATPWIAAGQASLSITNSRSLPKRMSIELVMPSNHLTLCRPLLFLPSIFPSIRVFSDESALGIKCPKYWSYSFNISSSNEHPGLISFQMDWLDLLTVQGTLKSLLQYLSSKASILWCATFFMVQLSHPYMTTGKSIALTRWDFVGKVMSLLFNMLSRWVITFLPRSKHLLTDGLHHHIQCFWRPQK